MPSPLLRERIARQLAGSQPCDDPADFVLPGLDGPVPPAFRNIRRDRLTPAAVLIALRGEGDDLRVVLTRRTDHLKNHAGQISLPGGRVETSDPDVRHAALRESEEEIGLPPGRVETIGYLPNFLTTSAYSVTPVVGFVDEPFTAVPDPSEVAEVFEVPLQFLFEPANQRRSTRSYFGAELPVFEFLYRDWRIWGVTAGVLMSFYYAVNDKKENS